MLARPAFTPAPISVLFSEPKIPQSTDLQPRQASLRDFSALQRAENSSMQPSASGKGSAVSHFSALQRAENSSIPPLCLARQFVPDFSALQRAENSSILRAANPIC